MKEKIIAVISSPIGEQLELYLEWLNKNFQIIYLKFNNDHVDDYHKNAHTDVRYRPNLISALNNLKQGIPYFINHIAGHCMGWALIIFSFISLPFFLIYGILSKLVSNLGVRNDLLVRAKLKYLAKKGEFETLLELLGEFSSITRLMVKSYAETDGTPRLIISFGLLSLLSAVILKKRENLILFYVPLELSIRPEHEYANCIKKFFDYCEKRLMRQVDAIIHIDYPRMDFISSLDDSRTQPKTLPCLSKQNELSNREARNYMSKILPKTFQLDPSSQRLSDLHDTESKEIAESSPFSLKPALFGAESILWFGGDIPFEDNSHMQPSNTGQIIYQNLENESIIMNSYGSRKIMIFSIKPHIRLMIDSPLNEIEQTIALSYHNVSNISCHIMASQNELELLKRQENLSDSGMKELITNGMIFLSCDSFTGINNWIGEIYNIERFPLEMDQFLNFNNQKPSKLYRYSISGKQNQKYVMVLKEEEKEQENPSHGFIPLYDNNALVGLIISSERVKYILLSLKRPVTPFPGSERIKESAEMVIMKFEDDELEKVFIIEKENLRILGI